MSAIASQITSLTSVYSTVYPGADQSKHQSSASLAFVWGIHRGPVNSPHKWPVTRKMFPFDDVIMVGRWVKVLRCQALLDSCDTFCSVLFHWHLGGRMTDPRAAIYQKRRRFTGIGSPIINLRWSNERLKFIKGSLLLFVYLMKSEVLSQWSYIPAEFRKIVKIWHAWYHQKMTPSNGNISALLVICAGNSPVTGKFPVQRPVTRSFGVFFDLRLNKRLGCGGRLVIWDTIAPIVRHCNEYANIDILVEPKVI